MVLVIKIRNGDSGLQHDKVGTPRPSTERLRSGRLPGSYHGRKKQQNGKVPKGDEFMGGTSTDDIKAALKKEKRWKDLKVALVLLACLWRGNGRDGTWIADTVE